MKNIFFILLSFFSVLSLNSCREDGEWGNENGGQFGFTIERDKDFIEKGVGEENQLKFNIKPSYDFSSIKTIFKYTTDKNGTLSINGESLIANKEYEFKDQNNIFKYIGLEQGQHNLKISVKNEKGASKEEEFELKYAISDFTVNSSNPTTEIYQGRDAEYIVKITPSNPTNINGYKIKFDSYTTNPNSKIYFNNQTATIGTFYDINPSEIQNIHIRLNSLDAGTQKLSYTIKNTTVQKTGNEIIQDIKPRGLTIVSMAPSHTTIGLNQQLSLNGVVTKTPFQDNTTVYYKTWISSNSPNGITTTNNAWQLYSLGSNNTVNIPNMTTNAFGIHTLNIQFKDEFGNQSEVKTFDIVVEDYVTFLGTQTAELLLAYQPNAVIVQKGFNRTFEVKAGGNSTITNIHYQLDYDMVIPGQATQHKSYSYSETPSSSNSTVSISGFYNTNNISINSINLTNTTATNRTLKITATSSIGQTKQITVVPSFNGIPPL